MQDLIGKMNLLRTMQGSEYGASIYPTLFLMVAAFIALFVFSQFVFLKKKREDNELTFLPDQPPSQKTTNL